MKAAGLAARVHRIGRVPNPFAWPSWSFAGPDGTFGNRFDDPQLTFRVLYAATEREGAYIETLATFRPDPTVFAVLDSIDADPKDPSPPRGVVPNEWFKSRQMGVGTLHGSFVDLGAAETLAELRSRLAAVLVHYTISDLDGAAIRLSVPRGFTQEISRTVYEMTIKDGERKWGGIAYQSRLGDDLQNWAMFEPNQPRNQHVENLDRTDPALTTALTILGLELQPDG